MIARRCLLERAASRAAPDSQRVAILGRLFWSLFVLVTAYGACVGSFLNVVIYRIPEGKSLWRRQSACPRCGSELRWFENVPVIAWLALRGKCRSCKAPISPQYLLVELLCAVLYAALFYVYFATSLRPEFAEATIRGAWPVLVVHLVLVGCLVAATFIDARFYIIPLSVPWFVTVLAVLVLPISATWLPMVQELTPQTASDRWFHTALTALLGLVVALLLMRLGWLPRSFDDIDEPESSAPDAKPSDGLPQPQQLTDIHDWLAYPHPRREICKECLFVALPVIGAVIGYFLIPVSAKGVIGQTYPVALHTLGGVVMGYLAGGAMIWGTRILGTLGFGKEAMGLGDVHLLAAVGAVLGARDAVLVFLVAPFLGLAYAAVEFGASSLLKVRHRPIPYGPHLAIAAIGVMFFRQILLDFLGLS